MRLFVKGRRLGVTEFDFLVGETAVVPSGRVKPP